MSARRLTRFEQILGPRPGVTLVIADNFVQQIWVAGRAPHITLCDYDWGIRDPAPYYDRDGIPFSPISWKRPAWALGLRLHPGRIDE